MILFRILRKFACKIRNFSEIVCLMKECSWTMRRGYCCQARLGLIPLICRVTTECPLKVCYQAYFSDWEYSICGVMQRTKPEPSANEIWCL